MILINDFPEVIPSLKRQELPDSTNVRYVMANGDVFHIESDGTELYIRLVSIGGFDQLSVKPRSSNAISLGHGGK